MSKASAAAAAWPEAHDAEDESDSSGGSSEYEDASSESSDGSEEFEDQGSSSESEAEESEDEADDAEDNLPTFNFDEGPREASSVGISRAQAIARFRADGSLSRAQAMEADDLSSDDEDQEGANTIGRVPLHWYDEFDHIGYDVTGRKVARGSGDDGKDLLDKALEGSEKHGLKGRVIYDAYNGREVVLSDRDLEIIRRISSGAVAHAESEQYPDYVPYFSSVDPIKTSMNAETSLPKRRFLPSKWEAMRVHKIVEGIKSGRILPRPRLTPEELEREREERLERSFALWNDSDENDGFTPKGLPRIPAPKMALPGHAESYRPPEEYLFDAEERKAWEECEPRKREISFPPQRFDSLRHVGAFRGFVKERFERCLDLYLCPRAFNKRLNIDPESLVPEMPKPRDLRPYPNALARVVRALPLAGAEPSPEDADALLRPGGRVDGAAAQTIAVSPGDGQWVAVGCRDGCVRVYESATGRLSFVFECYAKVVTESNEAAAKRRRERDAALAAMAEGAAAAAAGQNGGSKGRAGAASSALGEGDGERQAKDRAKVSAPVAAVRHVAWNPNPQHALLAACAGTRLFLIALPTAGAEAAAVTEALLEGIGEADAKEVDAEHDQEAETLLGSGGGGSGSSGEGGDARKKGTGAGGEEEEEGENKVHAHVKWRTLRPSSASLDAAKAAQDAKAAAVRARGGALNAPAEGENPLASGMLSTGRRVVCGALRRSSCGLQCGVRAVLELGSSLQSCAWHRKGDYLATLCPASGAAAVLIHQISRGRSQQPFRKALGKVTCVAFHPSKPFLFVATQQSVRVYHLVQQALVKELRSNCKWISSMDVHPTGDHVLLGTFDKKVAWFDLDLGSTPYKTLKYHGKAVRDVAFHSAHPLFATASDDGAVHVFHARVYDDLMRNPLLVPLKILRAHEVTAEGLGVLGIAWHPRQPWLFACGADGNVTLFQDI